MSGFPNAVSVNGGSTISPRPDNPALTLIAPAYTTDASNLGLLKLSDVAGTNAPLLNLEHAGAGSAGVYQAYGVNIHNLQGALSAFVIHQYSNQGTPAFWVDNTGHFSATRIKAAENQTTNPNSTGTGPYVDYSGYACVSYTDGQGISGSPGFGSALLWDAQGAAAIGHSILTDQVSQLSEPAYITAVPQTTLDVSMNGLSLPQGTIAVVSTAGFAASGTLMITSSGGTKLVNYTGVTATTFTGCTGGSGVLSTGGGVRQYTLSNNVNSTTGGMTIIVNTGASQTNGRLLPNNRFVSHNALLPWTFSNAVGISVVGLQVRQYSNSTAFAINNQGSGSILVATSNSAGTTKKIEIDSSGKITTLNGATVTITAGTGDPENVVTAPVGSIFLRTDGGALTSFYVKETGAGNTGWVAK